MCTTTGEQFQSVFFWRWQSPAGQMAFTLHVRELERSYQEAQQDLEDTLDRDEDIQPPGQQQFPYPGLDQIGGNYGREQPQLSLLAACLPPQPTRLDIDTGWGDADVVSLAERLGFVAKHTGRPKGLSPSDYAAQREWTIARSLSFEFFLNCQELPSAPVVWRDRFGDAAVILGFLLWARRLGRHGITLSGPQWATVLGVGIATVWRYLRALEQAGMLIRMHRWKPGKGKRPVALTGNWYGFGPAALATLAELEKPQDAVKKARLRLRRRHLRAKQRREGRQLLRGYAYPPQEEWLAQQLASTEQGLRRDEARWVDFQAGIAPSDFTSTVVPSFVVTWERNYNYADESPLAPVPAPLVEAVPASIVVVAPPDHRQGGNEEGPLIDPVSGRDVDVDVEKDVDLDVVNLATQNTGNGGETRGTGHDTSVGAPDEPTSSRGRESARRSEKPAAAIPISARDGASVEGLKPERNGPGGANTTRPPRPAREQPPPIASASGPPGREITVNDREWYADRPRFLLVFYEENIAPRKS